MRLLCISDVHGHERALAAVLATAERRGYTHLLVAGDLCFPGPDPLRVWQRLREARAIVVQGLSDRAIASIDPAQVAARTEHERERLARLREAREALGPAVLAQIAGLPTMHRMELANGDELVLVHGSPADPSVCITHDMPDDEVRALLSDDPADVVVCGGSHVPFDRMVMGVRIVNVGSVGEAPGQPPHAHATLIEVPSADGASNQGELIVEPIVIPLA